MTFTRGRELQRARTQGLFDLPSHVRHRIYQYLGIARFDSQPFTYYLGGRKPPPRSEDSISEHDPPLSSDFMGLLRSCRALYAESTALLYSANQFVIFYSHRSSLGPLRALSPRCLTSLTSLKIVLNESSCHDPTESWQSAPQCCCYGHGDVPWPLKSGVFHCEMHHRDKHSRPLLDSTPGMKLEPAEQMDNAATIMTEWHETAAYLSPHIAAGRLTLLFVCDIDSERPSALDIARLAIAPIALFPRLKSCHVRLCKLPNHPLQKLAQEAVIQSQSPGIIIPLRLESPGTLSRSTLMSLPTEVCLRILEYTDLITPWKEVTWGRDDSKYQVHRPHCNQGKDPHIHHGCRLSRCDPGDDHVKNAPRSPGCFCRRRHGAFSLVCNCWCPPTYLFLICGTLRREAEFVFFSHNRFIVHDYQPCRPWQLPALQIQYPNTPDPSGPRNYYPFQRYAASEFLQDVVPADCLTHLRFLELVFPPYVPHGWPQKEHDAVWDWFATVRWLRGRINAPALTIRLVMADFHMEPSVGRNVMTKPLANQILDGNKFIMHPLRALVREDGLAAFYMEAAEPWRWTLDNRLRAARDSRLPARFSRHMKKIGEEYVRGNGISPSPNRPEPRRSTWWFWYDDGLDLAEIWSTSIMP